MCGNAFRPNEPYAFLKMDFHFGADARFQYSARMQFGLNVPKSKSISLETRSFAISASLPNCDFYFSRDNALATWCENALRTNASYAQMGVNFHFARTRISD